MLLIETEQKRQTQNHLCPNVLYSYASGKPIIVNDERACPPEECGGVWGYQEFLEAIMNPAHREHEAMLTWIGGNFDPEVFDLSSVNASLRRLRV